MDKCFEHLPIEILSYIFKLLDVVAIYNCLFVCMKWRSILISDVICNDWRKLNQYYLSNELENVRIRSGLSDEDIFYNTQLWHRVREAKYSKIASVKFYNEQVKKVQVFRDYIRVVYQNTVDSFKITADHTNLKYDCRVFHRDLCCYEENNHFIAFIKQSGLTLKLKEDFQDSGFFCHGRCEAIKLNENGLYFTDDKRNIWFHCGSEPRSCLAKYYGSGRLVGIHLYGDEVYVLTSLGEVLVVMKEEHKFNMVLRFPRPIIERVYLMFDNLHMVVAASADEEFECNTTCDRLYLRYPNLTCAVRHGILLIFGFSDGMITINLLKNVLSKILTPDLQMNVKDFKDYKDEDPAITNIDVHEILNNQQIVITTSSYLYIVSIEHKN